MGNNSSFRSSSSRGRSSRSSRGRSNSREGGFLLEGHEHHGQERQEGGGIPALRGTRASRGGGGTR